MTTRWNTIVPNSRKLTFWHFHFLGWMIFWASDLFLITLQHGMPAERFVQIIDVPFACFLTIGLREIYRRLRYQFLSIVTLIAYILYWSLIATVVWYIFLAAARYYLVGPNEFYWTIYYVSVIQWIGYLAPIIFGWSVLYFAIKYWFEWTQEKERSQRAVSLAQRAQLQMLRYQVNPHFLFNALNSVRALIDEDTTNAKGMITELSEFLRYSLTTRDCTETTLQNEMEAIRSYLSIEKKRFEDKLEITFTLQPEAEQISILTFLIHPFVENAIKYGMRTSPMPLKIHISALLRDDVLQITVANSGHWLNEHEKILNHPEGTGTGLENMRARLENAYPNHYRLYTEERDGWVFATIELPASPRNH